MSVEKLAFTDAADVRHLLVVGSGLINFVIS